MTDIVTSADRLRSFVVATSKAVSNAKGERQLISELRILLHDLVSCDDWLPDLYAAPGPNGYRQYLLHCDSAERFSVVSFVWGPGQATPVHNHGVWGLVGVLRGAELVQDYAHDIAGALVSRGPARRLEAGAIDEILPSCGDIHRVVNAFADRISISIHVYGGNIGRVVRTAYKEDGGEQPFLSRYADTPLPNIW